ncbi:MAG: gamma-glutamyltransferase [Betaproteobacteria bacterium]
MRFPPVRSAAVLAVLLVWAATLCAPIAAQESPSGWTRKALVTSRHAMVVAAHPAAVDAGIATLARGGNAVDAAIAVQLVLNVVEPQSSGIGGGAFMLFHDGRSGRLTVYDGRETAPAAATPDRFLDAAGRPLAFTDALVGGRSVGVPGLVRMLELAHRKHGRLAWSRLFEPAIAIADKGFRVSARLRASIADESTMPQERARRYFFNADGAPLAEGQWLRNPALAETFRQLAARGGDAFYEGEIARDIVETVTGSPVNPGDMTEADLAGYRARAREPVCGRYRGLTVCSVPLPSAGALTLLQILGMLETFDLAALGANSLMSAHLFSEAGRLAYADRDRYLADPDFVKPPPGLLDPAYLHERAANIRTDRTLGRAEPGLPSRTARGQDAAFGNGVAPELVSTSHFSIVDRWGNAVAMTSTIENAFGSRLMTRSGFLLNNELTDFSFVPVDDAGRAVANRVEPGKRPRSAMSPTIAYDSRGRVAIVVGSPGGPAIINYVAKTLIGIVDWRLDAQAAIDLPNIGSRNGPTELERGTTAELLQPKLDALGHRTRVVEQTSGVHAIVRTAHGWSGGADPRREGVARGY